MKKVDPRVRRTQQMLKDAVLQLIQEGHHVHELNVQKVTAKAALNRTTFYLHYEDIQALVKSMTDDLLEEVSVHIDTLMRAVEHEQQQLVSLLDYLYAQRFYLRVLVQLDVFEEHLHRAMKLLIERRRHRVLQATAKMAVDANIKAASLVGVIMWWLQNGLQHSAHYIAEQLYKMYRA